MSLCYCGSEKEFNVCCDPIIKGSNNAVTAEDLMRARYSAYIVKDYDFLKNSLHPDSRDDYDAEATKQWAESAEWEGLEIVNSVNGAENDTEAEIEFKVNFKLQGSPIVHHEMSEFKKHENNWYFLKGENVVPKPVRNENKIGRNEPCPCGSGKKYKKCCAG